MGRENLLKDIELSAVVPVYNEEKQLRETVSTLENYLEGTFSDYEIVLVDDGSTDETSRILADVEKRFDTVKIFSCGRNRGKGYAVRKGMIEAAGEYQLFLDADLSTPIQHVDDALNYLREGHDVVIGSREHPETIIENHQFFLREYVGKMLNFFIRYALGLEYHDTQAGFKAFTETASEELFSTLELDGWLFDVEILLLCERFGFSVKVIPVDWTHHEQSHVSWRDVPGVVSEFLYLLRKVWRS
jgi:dolichyl-phosphate beta-glucosyltransferase